MRVARLMILGLSALALLATLAATGYVIGRSDAARSPLVAPTADPCAAEAAAYANAGSSSNAAVLLIARDDFQKCRAHHR